MQKTGESLRMGNLKANTQKSDEALSIFRKEISSLLSRWTALQLAVHNQWGGSDSLQKSHQLADDVFSCLIQSKGAVYAEDIENFLHESLLLRFSTEIEDGSIEEVAEQLVIIYEEYLQGTY